MFARVIFDDASNPEYPYTNAAIAPIKYPFCFLQDSTIIGIVAMNCSPLSGQVK